MEKEQEKKTNKKNFNDFRFAGLNYKKESNKYWTMDRVSSDENKIVVKVADSHLVETRYGYALIVNCNHVVFLKEWQVSRNYFGNEVLLTREYFNVKEWGEFNDFGDDKECESFDYWVEGAKEQDALVDEDGWKLNKVKWEK